MNDRPPVNGLLLAGGKSRRMGRDKASMRIGDSDLNQAEQGAELLKPFCREVVVSLRGGQESPIRQSMRIAVIEDCFEAVGPLAGILSAFDHEPNSAWLVIACDLPFLNREVIAYLLSARNADSPVFPFTAYQSSTDGLPEPVCAVYEPSAFPILRRHYEEDHSCPRRILIDEHCRLIPLPQGHEHTLANINTPEDLTKVEQSTSTRIR